MFSKVLAGLEQMQSRSFYPDMEDVNRKKPLTTDAGHSYPHYFTPAQIEHLRCFYALGNNSASLSDILKQVLQATHMDFNQLKLAKALQLFSHGELDPEKTARVLEHYCQMHKPPVWHWVQFWRHQHLRRFVKLFKAICLRELFLSQSLLGKANARVKGLSVALAAKYKSENEQDSCEQVQSLLHASRHDRENKIMRSVEDYIEAYRQG